MEYREIKEENISEMAEIFTEAFNREPWNDEWTQETAFKRLHSFVNTEGAYGLCAYNENKLRAFILGAEEQYYDGRVFNIKEFAVNQNERGAGIGSAIYGELEKRLKEMGIKRIVLNTIRGRYTEGFYNKKGFETSSQIICMEREI